MSLHFHKASITVPSHPMYLSIIRVFIERMLLLIDMQRSVVEDIKSAVDEACANVIKYAYKHDYSQTIEVYFECLKTKLTVTIKDKGDKPQDIAFKGRDLLDVRPGGLGMHFIKKAFDMVSFSSKGSINKLTLIKNISVK